MNLLKDRLCNELIRVKDFNDILHKMCVVFYLTLSCMAECVTHTHTHTRTHARTHTHTHTHTERGSISVSNNKRIWNNTEFLQRKICIMDHIDTQKFMYRVKDMYLSIFLIVL